MKKLKLYTHSLCYLCLSGLIRLVIVHQSLVILYWGHYTHHCRTLAATASCTCLWRWSLKAPSKSTAAPTLPRAYCICSSSPASPLPRKPKPTQCRLGTLSSPPPPLLLHLLVIRNYCVTSSEPTTTVVSSKVYISVILSPFLIVVNPYLSLHRTLPTSLLLWSFSLESL